jgi:tetratricopeptide (TPR) repeat protein
MRPLEVAGPAKRAAEKAVSLDPTLAEAYTARGMSELFNDWDPKAALADFEKAISLDQQNSFPRLFRAWPLVILGRTDEALAEMRRARALDPLSAIINTRVGSVLVYQRKYDEATAELRKALDLDPGNVTARFELGRALSLAGRPNDAFSEFPDALDMETGYDMSTEALAYGRAGHPERAREILARLQARSSQHYTSSVALCVAALGAGDKTLALDYLDKALEEHALLLVFIARDPSLDALRDSPRFKRVKDAVESKYTS